MSPRRPFPTNNINGGGRAIRYLKQLFRCRLKLRGHGRLDLLKELDAERGFEDGYRPAIARLARKYRRQQRGGH